MKPLKKIGLMVLFSGGLVVIACAILRVVLLVAVRVYRTPNCRDYAKI